MKNAKQIGTEIFSVTGLVLALTLGLAYLIISFVLNTTIGRLAFLSEEFLSIVILILKWSLYIYFIFWHLLPMCIFEVEPNTGVIVFNIFSLASKDDKLAGQREVGSGFRLKLPWEEITKTIKLEWITINIPEGFKARSKKPEKVEVGIKGYQKWRPALGHLKEFNLHDETGITSVLQGRMEGFLSTKIAEYLSDDLPTERINISGEFNKEYGPGKVGAAEADYGIEVEDFNIIDFQVSKAVELANELSKVTEAIRTEAKKFVQDGIVNGEPTISMKDATIVTASAAGAIDPKFSIIDVGALTSGDNKKKGSK